MLKKLSICLLVLLTACGEKKSPPPSQKPLPNVPFREPSGPEDYMPENEGIEKATADTKHPKATAPANPPDSVKDNSSVPTAFKHADSVSLAGSIVRHIFRETAEFNLQVVTGTRTQYEILGTTLAERSASTETMMDWNPVQVSKTVGLDDRRTFRNDLEMLLYMRNRAVRGYLAGIPIRGTYSRGILDDQIELAGLTVGLKPSQGIIEYFNVNGHASAVNDLTFGTYAIRPLDSATSPIINYDIALKFTPIQQIALAFGDLIVEGRLIWNKPLCDGCWLKWVRNYTANVSLKISRRDGQSLQISEDVNTSTSDEEQIRAFLAFLMLITPDLF